MKLSAPIYQLKRRAKLLARNEHVPLHTALDRVARDEGFARWGLLSARVATAATASEMLSRLSDGDMLLMGARPGHGKTLLGLQLLLDAIRDGRRGVFFTLEYTEQETHARIRSLEGGSSGLGTALEIVTSDEICAEYIMRYLADASPGTVAVIDYLQILDQRRNKPELSEQITSLQNFARKTGNILAFVSQIDRGYDPEVKPLPDMQDIRLPNTVDVRLFSKACFLHDGKAQFLAIA
ncbi:MAG: DNA helicase [Gluconobacter cerinus]|uniref:DNA helicase n=1 Tax=Gluconobacter cerinus TaxID=38307 RepID=UPI0039E84770